jgi:dTDP-4-dehydrorhamnose 3,5-epimerase
VFERFEIKDKDCIMIDGVLVTELKKFSDSRGKVLRMIDYKSAAFAGFGELYFSCVYPKKVKAWHLHKVMTLNYAVPIGKIKLVLYDPRLDSPTYGKTQELIMGEEDYFLVTVPPFIWNGFRGEGDEMSLVANCASIIHADDEIVRITSDHPSIPFNWFS